MMAIENNTEVENGGVSTTAKTAVTFFSQNLGVTFADDNSVAKNPALLDALSRADADNVTREDGFTTFPVDAAGFAHFMHMLYCSTPDGQKLQVNFDGIWPFDGTDLNGNPARFNAQLVTMAEVAE